MNRKAVWIPALLILLGIAALFSGCDPYHGKRPTNYKNTCWTCEDPEIVFYVRADGTTLLAVREPGVQDPDSLALRFDYGSGLHIGVKGRGEDLLYGTCKFSSKELRVKVEKDEIFGGKSVGKTLVFTSSDWDGTLPTDVTEPDTAAEPVDTEPLPQTPLPENLLATWVNAGAYSGGRDFVETLTLFDDNTVRVHLDYEGKPYTDLTGTVVRRGKTLVFYMSDGTERTYEFEVDANILTLTSEDRSVTYRRSD